MSDHSESGLSRRERQIMDSLYRRKQATVTEIMEDLPAAPTDSALRAMLRLLEAKGRVKRHADGRRHIYEPVIEREVASASALQHLMRTFFDGSPEKAVRALISASDSKLNDAELDRLIRVIEDAKKKEQGSAE